MKNENDQHNSNEVKQLIFMTGNEYLLHLGEHYEDKILKAKKDIEPVIRIINVNGNPSSIPLERALYMLEKFYKLSGKVEKKKDNIISIQPDVELSHNEATLDLPEEQMKMA